MPSCSKSFILTGMCIDRSDGQFFKAMEWRWSFKILTITIDGSWQDQPLEAMVFPILGTNGSRWLQTEICDKLHINKDIKNRYASYQFIFLKCSVQKYYYYVQKNCLFCGSCRNITIQGQGVPRVPCRAIFGVRAEILSFGEIFTSVNLGWSRKTELAPHLHT